MPNTITLVIETAGARLDSALAEHMQHLVEKPEYHGTSRTQIQTWIKKGLVLVNNEIGTTRTKMAAGDVITISLPPILSADPLAENIPLDIIHEDKEIVVINKKAGMVVHPSGGHSSGTLVNALLGHCGSSLSGIGGVARPGIVHRLDKDTSGVMVVAKNDAAHQHLSAQFADHGETMPFVRRYIGYCWGAPHPTLTAIEAPLGRDPRNPEKQKVLKSGRYALTYIRQAERLDTNGRTTRLTMELATGRTHQIRAHLAHAGHPLIGDPVYSTGFQTRIDKFDQQTQVSLRTFKRQALHAQCLQIIHPKTKKIMLFEAEVPDDMQKLAVVLTKALSR